MTTTPTTLARASGCTNLRLRQLVRRVSQRYDAEMSVTGLKTTQYSLLSYVLRLGPLRPGELAAQMKMDPSTLTRNLKPLVAAGWVEQGAGTDARSRWVSITPAGREKRAEALQHWRLAQERLNQTLGLERVVALHTLIDEVMALLEPVSDPDAQDEHNHNPTEEAIHAI